MADLAVRLADTGLVVSAAPAPAPSLVAGLGRTARTNLGIRGCRDESAVDVVVTNVIVFDPVDGLRQASIGIVDGTIVRVGVAGNPDTMDGVDIVVDLETAIVQGEGLIATPGAVDTHVHALAPSVLSIALMSGTTSLLTQNSGIEWGSGINSPWLAKATIAAFEASPVSFGWLARGNSTDPEFHERALNAGASGFKIHEDFGLTPSILDSCLSCAERNDVQVALHTDTLNESMSLEDTLDAVAGRTIHAFHVEGCGGGHAPKLLEIVNAPNVIGSSTTPTIPFGVNAASEQLNMIMQVHGLSPSSRSDVQLATKRVRSSTMATESMLHAIGVVPIINSDAQGMGRASELFRSAFAMASWSRHLEASSSLSDNELACRFLSKVTCNPAIAHGLANVGRLAPGYDADIVLWKPSYFGAKPELVLKRGYPAAGAYGDPAGSTTLVEPVEMTSGFGDVGNVSMRSRLFVSSLAKLDDLAPLTSRTPSAVRGVAGLRRTDLPHHATEVEVRVDDDGGAVMVDGSAVDVLPVTMASLGRLYFL
jgi:urease subunit alpha